MGKKSIDCLVEFQIRQINKYLFDSEQIIKLSEEMKTLEGEIYWDLKWVRPCDKDTVIEEHVFGGDKEIKE